MTQLRGRVWAALLALALSSRAGAAWAEDDAARDLVRRALEALPKSALTAKLKLSSEQWPPRELRLSRKYVNQTHASYLEVTAPDELEGIRFLFLERPTGENEQYIKVAASRSSVRVTDEVRKQPFLSSAFYVSDLVLPELDDYTYRIVGEETLLGRTCKLVESMPKNPRDEVYSRNVVAIDPTDLLILKRQFFDKKNELFKVWTVTKVDKIDGMWTLLDQEMSNVKQNSKARLEVSDVKYNVELPDLMFTPTHLLR